MDSKNFRTRHEFNKRNTPKGTRDFIIGLDAGYSGMKVYHENGYFCFPSFVKKLTNDTINLPDEKDIVYRDKATGDQYMVGYTAQEMLGSTDTNDTDGEMFSRKRYGKKGFHILCNTAIALAHMNKADPRNIFVQTGLPSSYVKGDREALKKALSTPSDFSLKIGNGRWQDFHLDIRKDHIGVMPQPMGSMYSALIKNDGQFTDDATGFMKSNVLIIDIGFGTCDYYGFKNRQVVCSESIDEIGMLQVMKRTSQMILEEFGEDIRVQALQSVLEKGYVTCIDEDAMTAEDKPIAHILEKANRQVFEEAMERSKSITNAFRDYRYVIISGGTGDAWFDMIKDYLKGMKSLTVMPGNANDNAPMLYANARGYYLYRYGASVRNA